MARLIACIAAMVLGSGAFSHAFEVDGFRSGMSEEEALKLARTYDPAAAPPYREPPERVRSVTGVIDRASTDPLPKHWSLYFCDGKLGLLQKHYSLDWPKLAATLSELNARHGQGKVKSIHERILPDQFDAHRINLTWDGEAGSVMVAITSLNVTQRPGPRSRVDVGEFYKSKRFGACYSGYRYSEKP